MVDGEKQLWKKWGLKQKTGDIESNAHIKLFHFFIEGLKEGSISLGIPYKKEIRKWEAAFEQYMRVLQKIRQYQGEKWYSTKEICGGLPKNRWARMLLKTLDLKDHQPINYEAITKSILEHKVTEQ